MNELYFGRCQSWLNTLPEQSVDLVYIDPPFFTQKNWGAYDDRWESLSDYLEFMTCVLWKLHRVLKSTGSILLHCDWRCSHRLRYLLDCVFGSEQFLNELIWCYSNAGRSSRGFCKKHDSIFFYSKTKDFYWGDYKIPTPKKYFDSHYKQVDKNGNRCRVRVDAGKRRVYYPSDGVSCVDWWVDIPSLNSVSSERVDYPTQKPEALLERVVEACSKEGDTVLDCFGGSGTTAVVAHKLKRKFITGDVGSKAIEVMKQRFDKLNIEYSMTEVK